MEKQFKRTLITTALPYANGPVHIGHLAGVYVPADIYARYLRLKGEEVLMIGGSDEHGVPITLRAKKEGITLLRSLVSRSISIPVRLRLHIARWRRISSVPYTIKESLSRKQANSITTRKQNSSLPTVI